VLNLRKLDQAELAFPEVKPKKKKKHYDELNFNRKQKTKKE